MYTLNTIMRQMKELERVNSDIFSAEPVDGDLYHWKVMLMGPKDSPYENGVFELTMHIPPECPFKPPNVSFNTKIFHPNVGEHGNIFLKMLKNAYFSPIYTINRMLIELHAKLTAPEIGDDDHYDETIAKLYWDDKAAFDSVARAWMVEHAGGPEK
ncbi:ubiquitin-conjugating enzyme E2 28-like [Eutrema salsugineum]|uniref:ubiquitin-conjugating enzyme E2 28-like n=1 Tax=Eutrema salsugineum TaxID=72664 RepID=UPI000CED72E9|nr:ubiquitin-conjugating enzyme E2 28-like [Eutrema salsugineum]